jgi:hypothetical protein
MAAYGENLMATDKMPVALGWRAQAVPLLAPLSTSGCASRAAVSVDGCGTLAPPVECERLATFDHAVGWFWL